MNKDEIGKTLDWLRENQKGLLHIDKICNYIDANIDEFIECYEEVEE